MKSGTNALSLTAKSDYYPFGMAMPNQNAGSYRYAFQGQEKDPETGMEAFELRLWDGRIGRWLTVDPYGQYSSPYLGMGNNPISRIDPDGGTDGDPIKFPSNPNSGDTFKSDQGGNYTYNGKEWVGSGFDIQNLDDVVIGNSSKASLAAVGLLVMDSSVFTAASFGTTTVTAAGVGAVVGTGAAFGAMLMPVSFMIYLIENPPPKMSLEETIATTGVISCTAGPGAYRPERPELMPNLNDIMAATAVTQESIHQFAQRGNNNGKLQDDELAAILERKAAGTASSSDLQKLKKHEKNTNQRKSRQSKDRK